MNPSCLGLGPRSRPRPQPHLRGIRIRVKRRVARFCRRATGRVTRVLGRWCAMLRRRLIRVGPRSGPGYTRVGEGEDRSSRAPKGHLAVYVGPTGEGGAAGVAKRVVVPVIYINHPLFKRLLEEAEKKYGYDHPGGITLPCPVSEFEMVKTRIEAGRARNGLSPPWVGRSS